MTLIRVSGALKLIFCTGLSVLQTVKRSRWVYTFGAVLVVCKWCRNEWEIRVLCIIIVVVSYTTVSAVRVHLFCMLCPRVLVVISSSFDFQHDFFFFFLEDKITIILLYYWCVRRINGRFCFSSLFCFIYLELCFFFLYEDEADLGKF